MLEQIGFVSGIDFGKLAIFFDLFKLFLVDRFNFATVSPFGMAHIGPSFKLGRDFSY